MSYLEKNLSMLAKRFPESAAAVTHASADPRICVIAGEGKAPTVSYALSDESDIVMHSKYNPAREAVKLVEGYQLDESPNIVVLGFGFGYHVSELARRELHRGFIMISECNAALVRAAFEVIDFTEVLSQQNIFWAIGCVPDRAVNPLRDGHGLNVVANGVTMVTHPPSMQLYRNYYAHVQRAFEEFSIYAKVNVNTQLERSRNFVGNALMNAEAYVRALPVSELFDCARGLPAFIVGAGPSLDKTIHLLKEAVGKAVIIAVDSAAVALLTHGIRPDFVVSIDFTTHALKFFTSIDTENLTLVFDSEICPDIVKTFKGVKYAMHLPRKSVSDWYTDTIGNKGAMAKGLSVSHAGVLLALRMGAEEIVLVGQDLAYPRSHWHAKGSHFFQTLSVGTEQELNLCDTEDVFGGTLKSSVSLMVFKNHFESLFEAEKCHCYDATEGGARINGTEVISLREALVRFCRGRSWSFSPEVKENENYEQDMDVLCAEATVVIERLDDFITRAETMCSLLLDSRTAFLKDKSRDSLRDVLLAVRDTSQLLDHDKEILGLLKDLSTEAMLIRQRNRRSRDMNLATAREEDLLEAMQSEYDFFRVVKDSSIFLRDELSAVVARNHRVMA